MLIGSKCSQSQGGNGYSDRENILAIKKSKCLVSRGKCLVSGRGIIVTTKRSRCLISGSKCLVIGRQCLQPQGENFITYGGNV